MSMPNDLPCTLVLLKLHHPMNLAVWNAPSKQLLHPLILQTQSLVVHRTLDFLHFKPSTEDKLQSNSILLVKFPNTIPWISYFIWQYQYYIFGDFSLYIIKSGDFLWYEYFWKHKNLIMKQYLFLHYVMIKKLARLFKIRTTTQTVINTILFLKKIFPIFEFLIDRCSSF